MSEEVIEVRPTASEAGKKVIFGIIWVLLNMIKQLTDFWKTLTIWRLSIETTMGIPVWSNYASVRPSYLYISVDIPAVRSDTQGLSAVRFQLLSLAPSLAITSDKRDGRLPSIYVDSVWPHTPTFSTWFCMHLMRPQPKWWWIGATSEINEKEHL